MDAKQAKFNILLEEYKQHRAELVQTMTHTRNVTFWYISAFGLFISIIPFVVNSKSYVLFLLFPLVFQALLLTFLRYMLLHIEITRYLKDVTAPQIRSLFESDESELLRWQDTSGWSGPPQRYPRWLLLIPAAPALIPNASCVIAICAFFYYRPVEKLNDIELVLLFIDLAMIIYSLIASSAISSRKIHTN